MRTNIVIDDELLDEAFSVSNAKTKKDLIPEVLANSHAQAIFFLMFCGFLL